MAVSKKQKVKDILDDITETADSNGRFHGYIEFFSWSDKSGDGGADFILPSLSSSKGYFRGWIRDDMGWSEEKFETLKDAISFCLGGG